MKDLKSWTVLNNFKLHEIALLMLGHDVDKYVVDTESLLKEPPHGFQALYQRILADACYFLDDYEQIQIDPDVYRPVYELQTDKADNVDGLNLKDGLNISASLYDINSWIKRHADLGRPLPDKFFTVKHVHEGAVTEQTSPTYQTNLLKIQDLAIKHFYESRKPVDPKKSEVTEWIKNEASNLKISISDNIADAIFTIIKPDDHNPKIKRA